MQIEMKQMKYSTNLIATFIAILLTSPVFSQSKNDIDKELTRVMEAARADNSLMFSSKLITEKSADIILQSLAPYYSDSVVLVRSKAYNLAKKAGLKATDINIRQNAVVTLTRGCKDKDSGISGMVSRYLTEYLQSDFNDEAKNNIGNLLEGHPAHFDRIIKLVGFVQLKEKENRLFDILYTDSLLSKSAKWAVHLAIARMGNEAEVAYCVSKVSRYPLNDDVVYELLPDLIYVRQKAAIDYLVTALNEDGKNCSSPDPASDDNIICGYRIMEYLAPVVKDFPLTVGPSGDIQNVKYPEALELARKWFEENKEYGLITDTY